MARFEAGNTKPIGSGRKRGTRNKKSQHLADALEAIGMNLPERLGKLLPKLSPEKQADVLLSLMSFVYPKLKSIEHREAGSGALPPEFMIRFVDAEDGKPVESVEKLKSLRAASKGA